MKTKAKNRRRFCSGCARFIEDAGWSLRDRRSRRMEGSPALCDQCQRGTWRERRWEPHQ